MLFVAKRRIDTTVDQFKCHGFETSSQKTAKQLASHIVSTCNSVFRKLRRTRKHIRKRTEKEGKTAPVTSSKAEASTEEGERTFCRRTVFVETAPTARSHRALPPRARASQFAMNQQQLIRDARNCYVSSLPVENQELSRARP